jgi:putative ABC transport system substrate-binding protein
LGDARSRRAACWPTARISRPCTAASPHIYKILKTPKPAGLPLELPTTSDFVVNLSTARALALAIPQSVLDHASGVIQ